MKIYKIFFKEFYHNDISNLCSKNQVSTHFRSKDISEAKIMSETVLGWEESFCRFFSK